MNRVTMLIISLACLFFFTSDEAQAAEISLEDWCFQWEPSTKTCIVTLGTTVDANVTLIIQSDETLAHFGVIYDVGFHIDGTIINYGWLISNSWPMNNNGTIVNYGTFICSSHCKFNNSGNIENRGTVFNYSDLSNDYCQWGCGWTDNGLVTNHGTIENFGSLVGDGTIDNHGTIQNNSFFEIRVNIKNYGLLDNFGSLWAPQFDGSIHNFTDGTINNYANFENQRPASAIRNDGVINNFDLLLNEANFKNYGIIYNYDEIINQEDGIFSNFGDIENIGFIDNFGLLINCGNIYGDGTFNNYGEVNNCSYLNLPLIRSCGYGENSSPSPGVNTSPPASYTSPRYR